MYSGSILLFICILDLINIPFLNYYERMGNEKGIYNIMISQVGINIIYLFDLIIMMIIYGITDVLTNQSYSLRFEVLFQFINLCLIDQYVRILQFKVTPTEKIFLNDYFQIVGLIRLLRLFAFLNEVEQWRFFSNTMKVMRGPFFNLAFTLYSLYFFYVLIGIEIYGGKINTENFKALFRVNPDTDIAGDYIWLNFNDYTSGIITLFSMMLFNNWQFIWD